jgi:hypothetical protein
VSFGTGFGMHALKSPTQLGYALVRSEYVLIATIAARLRGTAIFGTYTQAKSASVVGHNVVDRKYGAAYLPIAC